METELIRYIKKIYFKFLKLEIPNILQIIGYSSLVSVFTGSIFTTLLFFIIVYILMVLYWEEKFLGYLATELVVSYPSEFKKENKINTKEIIRVITPYYIATICIFIGVILTISTLTTINIEFSF